MVSIGVVPVDNGSAPLCHQLGDIQGQFSDAQQIFERLVSLLDGPIQFGHQPGEHLTSLRIPGRHLAESRRDLGAGGDDPISLNCRLISGIYCRITNRMGPFTLLAGRQYPRLEACYGVVYCEHISLPSRRTLSAQIDAELHTPGDKASSSSTYSS
ncbi:hypothetical protein P3T76_006481 [Phytophthora citrophthora]|uniref:Uncharacterized protein n=1 Tax=Phytophthora citrophthora TaxID=4793 RepID=A0AAD9LPI4_9STRA|nr:hypothetical protein P3T76_006481 [Phytophthora citrophthora]